MVYAAIRHAPIGEAELGRFDAAEAKGRGLAQGCDRKDFALVPFARERHHFGARELASGLLEGALFIAESEIHGHER